MQNFMKTILSAFKTWTKKEIKNSTADWNQNDSSADNYVKNRPFYEYIAPVYYIEAQTITIDEDGCSSIINNTPYANLPNIGEECVIVFDGKSYLSTVYSGAIMGDTYYITEIILDTGESVKIGDGCLIESSLLAGEHTIAAYQIKPTVQKIDGKFLPSDDKKMDRENPTGTGIFSINRQDDSDIGACSFAEGYQGVASGDYSHAGGYNTIAQGRSQHASGEYNIPSGTYVQKKTTTTQVVQIGQYKTIYCSESYSFDTETGIYTLNEPIYSEENNSLYGRLENHLSNKALYIISGGTTGTTMYYSKAFHYGNSIYAVYKGAIKYTYAQASFNTGGYLSIVGNGTNNNARSNAHTLDWDGNAWYSGDVYVGSTSGTHKDDGSKKLATAEYVDSILETVDSKMDAADPVGTGSFSLNRKNETDIGYYSSVVGGYGCEASGHFSQSNGYYTAATARSESVRGEYNIPSPRYNKVELRSEQEASSIYHHLIPLNSIVYYAKEYEYNTETGMFILKSPESIVITANTDISVLKNSFVIIQDKQFTSSATGYSIALAENAQSGNAMAYYGEEIDSIAISHNSSYTKFYHNGSKRVMYSVKTSQYHSKYVDIVGNGTSDDARSNAHTLDWDGNAWYAGTVETSAIILRSSTPDSTKQFRITVDDSGTITATEVTS